MTSLVKISPLSLKKLNNAEYGAFMDSFAQLVEQGTIAKLGIAEADRTAFKANLSKMIDANMQNRKDELSDKLAECDEERDQLLSYFFKRIRAELDSPDKETRAKARTLGFAAGKYYGIEKKANRQETQLIKGLLVDMEKAEIKTLLEHFNLYTLLPKLKKLNEDYESFLEHRTNEGVLVNYIATKPLREEMNAQYEVFTTKLFALNLITPVPETQQAIADLNKLIKATTIAWKQRNGVAHLESEEVEEEETSES